MKRIIILGLVLSSTTVPQLHAQPTSEPTPSFSEFPSYVEPVQEQAKSQESETATESKRVDRVLKKHDEQVFDEDLIDIEEIPADIGVTATRQGWMSEDGQLFDRKWLEEKRRREKKIS